MLALLHGPAGTVGANSLRETVAAAIETSPDIGIARHGRLAADQELRRAQARYWPTLEAQGAVGPEHTRLSGERRRVGQRDDGSTLRRAEAQLTLRQILFDGHETRSDVERQAARASGAVHRVQEAVELTALDAIEAHLEAVRHETIVELNEANIDQHRRLLDRVRMLERSGRSGVADVRQSEARLAQSEDSLATSAGAHGDAVAAYHRAVGTPPGALTLEPLPLAAVPPGAEEAAMLASVANPAVLIAAADAEAAEAALRGARAGHLPRLDVEVSAGAVEDGGGLEGKEATASALLVARYNLFRGGGDEARRREAFHRVNEARARLQRARRQAEAAARVAFNALQTARLRAAALRNKGEAQRRTRDAYASQFQLGTRHLLDLLDAENELFMTRVALTTAEHVERLAVYRLLGIAGRLLDTLEISRPRDEAQEGRRAARLQTPETVRARTDPLPQPRSGLLPAR